MIEPGFTPAYEVWRSQRINNNTPKPNLEDELTMEKRLRRLPTEAELLKEDMRLMNLEREKVQRNFSDEKTMWELEMIKKDGVIKQLAKDKEKVQESFDALSQDFRALEKNMRAQGLHHTAKTLKIKLDRVERSARRGQEEKKRALQHAQKMREQRYEANQELTQKRAQIERLEAQLLSMDKTFHSDVLRLQKENVMLKKMITELEEARLIYSSAQDVARQENEALKVKIAELEAAAQDTIQRHLEVMERAVNQARDVARQVYEISEEATALRVFVIPNSEEERRILGLMIELERLGDRARFYV
ncbi:golgin subfamily A member 6-like protein 2 [Hibiscus syriacus]|uniref:golgin subfamily A member 6-like protein 2 n=1 Tax=Hibiscus syriacus TaxID=106335 RepID=UPI00192147B6|nr:golgin subfamily A member 6-like protein 2 [Hibiscus syriacus]